MDEKVMATKQGDLASDLKYLEDRLIRMDYAIDVLRSFLVSGQMPKDLNSCDEVRQAKAALQRSQDCAIMSEKIVSKLEDIIRAVGEPQ